MSSFRVPAAAVTIEQSIKNSRFICFLGQARNKNQALENIQQIRRLHPRANHVCWAYKTGPPDRPVRGMSDDGEPRNTAGKPILTMLDHSAIHQIWAAVVRYFGGVKLGKGGLIRAYSAVVRDGLNRIETETVEIVLPFQLVIDYSLLAGIEQLVAEENGTICSRNFDTTVTLKLLLPKQRVSHIQQRLDVISCGTLKLTRQADGNSAVGIA